MAERQVILQVQTCNLELAGEVMWFVNEWCKENGWADPRVKTADDGQAFTIHAQLPDREGKRST